MPSLVMCYFFETVPVASTPHVVSFSRCVAAVATLASSETSHAAFAFPYPLPRMVGFV